MLAVVSFGLSLMMTTTFSASPPEIEDTLSCGDTYFGANVTGDSSEYYLFNISSIPGDEEDVVVIFSDCSEDTDCETALAIFDGEMVPVLVSNVTYACEEVRINFTAPFNDTVYVGIFIDEFESYCDYELSVECVFPGDLTDQPSTAPSEEPTAAPTPFGHPYIDELNCSETWSGTTSSGSSRHFYSFDVKDYLGETIIFSTCDAETKFNTKLKLWTPDGELIAENDTNEECATNQSNAEIEWLVSNTSGTFVYVEVTGSGPSDYGDYDLRVNCETSTLNTTRYMGELNCNSSTAFGMTTDNINEHIWSFGPDPDTIAVEISTCFDETDFDTLIRLYDSDKLYIGVEYDDPSCADNASAVYKYELKDTSSDEFFIHVTSDADPDYGDYGISVTCYDYTNETTDLYCSDNVSSVVLENNTNVYRFPLDGYNDDLSDSDIFEIEFSVCFSDVNTRLSVYDPETSVITDDNHLETSCSFTIELEAPLPSSASLYIDVSSTDSAAYYTITAECATNSSSIISTTPTATPSNIPSSDPSATPTSPSRNPSRSPTASPTPEPTNHPTRTYNPSVSPTTNDPTRDPTSDPTNEPTLQPSSKPTLEPVVGPYVNLGTPEWTVKYSDAVPVDTYTFDVDDCYDAAEFCVKLSIDDQNGLILEGTAISSIQECDDCFWWTLVANNDTENALVLKSGSASLSTFARIYNSYVGTATGNENVLEYMSCLEVDNIRTEDYGQDLPDGICVDLDKKAELFLVSGYTYGLSFNFSFHGHNSSMSETEELDFYCNSEPYNGTCYLSESQDLGLLTVFNMVCEGWMDDEDEDSYNSTNVNSSNFTSSNFNSSYYLEYNAYYGVLLMRASYTKYPELLQGLVVLGDASFVVIVRDSDGMNACMQFDATGFPVNVSNTEAHFAINSAINDSNTSLGENSGEAATVALVVFMLFKDGTFDLSEASSYMTIIVGLVISDGLIGSVAGFENVQLTASDTTYELANMVVILSFDSDIIADDLTMTCVGYISDVVLVIAVADLSDDNGDPADESVYFVVVDEILILVSTTYPLVVGLVVTTSITVDDKNQAQEACNNAQTDAASLALSVSIVGAQYTGTSSISVVVDGETAYVTLVVIASIISTESGTDASLAEGGNIFLVPISVGTKISDAALISSLLLVDHDFHTETKRLNFIGFGKLMVVNIYDGSNSRRRRLSEAKQNEGADRRRMGSSLSVSYTADECTPYFITLETDNESLADSSYSLNNNMAFPECDFWNDTTWDTSDCYVYNYTDTSVTCACTHLTTFQLSQSQFIPKANIETAYDFRNVTAKNLGKYPTVWITILVLLSIFVIICLLVPKIEGRSILAYEDIIFAHFRDEKIAHDVSGKEIEYFNELLPNQDNIGHGLKSIAPDAEGRKNLCKLQFQLFLTYLRNDHTLLSMFQRDAGTNFSSPQRIACFFMYLCTFMMSSAVFYGVEQKGFGDVSASFAISLWSTIPVFAASYLFRKAKPEVQKRQITIKDVKEVAIFMNTDDVLLGQTPGGDGEGADVDVKDDAPDDEKAEKAKKPDAALSLALKSMDSQTRLALIHSAVAQAKSGDDRERRVQLVESVRVALFDKIYPFPRYFKKIAWGVIVVWCFVAGTIAIIYGLSFDLAYNEKYSSDYDSDCWEYNKKLVIENELSEILVADKQNQLTAAQYSDSYSNVTDSGTWLLSLFWSICISMILWQPLTVYVLTWIKLWLFTWNLKMALHPANLFGCCCLVLGCRDPHTSINRDTSGDATSIVSHKDRPLDIIGFFSNDALFLENNDIEADDVKDVDGQEEKKEEDAGIAAAAADDDGVQLSVTHDDGDDNDKKDDAPGFVSELQEGDEPATVGPTPGGPEPINTVANEIEMQEIVQVPNETVLNETDPTETGPNEKKVEVEVEVEVEVSLSLEVDVPIPVEKPKDGPTPQTEKILNDLFEAAGQELQYGAEDVDAADSDETETETETESHKIDGDATVEVDAVDENKNIGNESGVIEEDEDKNEEAAIENTDDASVVVNGNVNVNVNVDDDEEEEDDDEIENDNDEDEGGDDDEDEDEDGETGSVDSDRFYAQSN